MLNGFVILPSQIVQQSRLELWGLYSSSLIPPKLTVLVTFAYNPASLEDKQMLWFTWWIAKKQPATCDSLILTQPSLIIWTYVNQPEPLWYTIY